ncbi:unnamed protein product [Discula destructiva]
MSCPQASPPTSQSSSATAHTIRRNPTVPFEARGIEAHCPHLPTTDLTKVKVGDINHPDLDPEDPAGGYPQGDDDARVIVEVLKPLVNAGKKVLLIGHSAGGFVATQAALPEMQVKVRVTKDLSGGIIGIFYRGPFVIPVGESVNSFFQPKDGNLLRTAVHEVPCESIRNAAAPAAFESQGDPCRNLAVARPLF